MFISPDFSTISHTPTIVVPPDPRWRKVYFPFGKSRLAVHYDLQTKYHTLSGTLFGIAPGELRIDFLKNGVAVFTFFGTDLATQIFPFDDYANHPLD